MTKDEKILITVKAYPTLSGKYGELVCIGALTEEGSWLRIYPMPFRRYEELERFKKYTWVEMPLIRNSSDPRPESFRLHGWKYKKIEEVGTSNHWAERKEVVYKTHIYESMSDLIDKAKRNELSLATFKPAKIHDFVWEEVDREWDSKKLEKALIDSRQKSLFDTEDFVKDFKVIQKLPYRFLYKFEDKDGKLSTMMIEDWETGQLFWSCLKNYDGEQTALEKVKQKYLEEFVQKKDLLFFLGTTRQFHFVGKNPFLIVGTFYPPKPPKVVQRSFDFPD